MGGQKEGERERVRIKHSDKRKIGGSVNGRNVKNQHRDTGLEDGGERGVGRIADERRVAEVHKEEQGIWARETLEAHS